MAKRKMDCSLNDFVVDYLKKKKFETTLKLFDRDNKVMMEEKLFKKFINYLTKNELVEENANDELGFKINFGSYQSEPGLKLKQIPVAKQKKRRNEKEREKIEIPKKFIKKIKRLGMREIDAEILYKSKIDWTACYSDNKIYCPELSCDYSTKIENGDLTNHLISVHKYGEYKCDDPHCEYVAYSKTNLNIHRNMHKRLPNKMYLYKCPKVNCEASFPGEWKLNLHVRLHENNLHNCQFCPYRYAQDVHYIPHLKNHFRIQDYKCDQCGKKFNTLGHLNLHCEIHEGIIHSCLICKKYEAKTTNTMAKHLKNRHREVLGKSTLWEDIKQFTRTK